MADFQHVRLIEALLFASAEPLDERSLAARLPPDADLGEILDCLVDTYAERGVTLVQRDGRWAFRTATDLAAALVIEHQVERKLSRAAIETLAIVAYHQPVTRAEIEEIRGVALSKGTLDALFEAGWIRPRGRRQTPGRPMLWGTTPGFLDHFGLVALDDLPGVEELKAAGLLDARPALSAYANRAGDEGEPFDVADDLDDEALERKALGILHPGQHDDVDDGGDS
jgi:segregation and condensation protein B